MAVVPRGYRSVKGVSPSKLVRNLIAGLGMQGVGEIGVDSKRWEKGLIEVISFGKEKGMKFNFRLILPNHVHSSARGLGLLLPIEEGRGMRYKIRFKSKEAAREYLGDYVNEKKIALYGEMAKRFLSKFGSAGLGRVRHGWEHPDKNNGPMI